MLCRRRRGAWLGTPLWGLPAKGAGPGAGQEAATEAWFTEEADNVRRRGVVGEEVAGVVVAIVVGRYLLAE